MNVNVTIQLLIGEYAADLSGNSEELAKKILLGVGGNLTEDVCTVAINDYGSVGTMPASPAQVPPQPAP
jgi:hypothetical protein